ncbi:MULTISPECIES: PAS domain-containing sensor histidine kinase [Niastella]|uniref:histidine kinase n=1 Tax=Niastella soli TaxID=2821487 RepID=A0ABS3YNP7_9BACT|nr:PAS domain-containing sensor histidine kinase [Niastella soli]MBO9199508.1 PAS domain S-box protein [Niastella soli]
MLKQSKKSIPEVTYDYTALSLQTDKAGIILSASADLLSFTGKHQEALIGNSFKKIIDSADKPKLQAILNTGAGIDTGLHIQLAVKGKSGVRHIGFRAIYQQSNHKPNDVINWNAIAEVDEQTESLSAQLEAARRELKEVTERYKVIVQQSSEIIWRCELQTPVNINDPLEKQLEQLFEGCLAECNDQMAHFYGFENVSDVIGKKVSVFFDPNEPVTYQVATEFIQQDYKIYRRLSMHFDHQGNKRYFLNNLVGVVENERLLRIWTTQNEITQLRMAEKANRYQATVLENVFDAVMSSDENYITKSFNQAAEKLFGIKAADIMGQPIHELIDFHFHDTTREQLLEDLFTKGAWTGEISFIRASDEKRIVFWSTISVVRNKKGQITDIISINKDLTERKQAEQVAELELKRSQQQLTEYSERITNILASITDGFIAVDKNLNIFLWNHAVEHLTGLEAKHVIGSGVEKIFPGLIDTAEFKQYVAAINKDSSSNFEHFLPTFNRWLETSVYPFSQGAFIYFRDITDRKNQERLLELEKQVLEINAQPAASLKATIDYFLDGLEKIFADVICSVIMLNDDKQTIMHLSGPSLSDEFSRATNGIKIGPYVASCGTAIYRKERVITVDIDTDPLWEDYKAFALKFGLRSCWSFPILNASNDVLASIAIYHRYPATPTEAELSLLERVVSLLRIIIENKNAELKIRLSNERYLLVTKATNDAIWDWDVNTNTLYWGEGIYTLFGFKPGYVDNSSNFWESCIHPDDRDRVVNGLNKFITDSTSKIWEDEYRFIKPNGQHALVFDRGFLIYDHSGKIARMVGSMQDITDKKELEKKLLKQQVDKQKLIAQAVVNAQEKERAEIGKELHDNVNQILSTAKLYLELALTDDGSRLELISRSTNNISDAINEIRTISRSLVPPSIGDLGLIDSVQDLVENIKATKRLHVEFYYSGNIDDILDEKRKLMLFRIIQEQVNNVLKHAAAKNLVIELIADSEGFAVDLTISDDGKGFELDKVRSKKGVGLSNIASRAQLFNGSVHIVTAPGDGCKLKINVPISNI